MFLMEMEKGKDLGMTNSKDITIFLCEKGVNLNS